MLLCCLVLCVDIVCVSASVFISIAPFCRLTTTLSTLLIYQRNNPLLQINFVLSNVVAIYSLGTILLSRFMLDLRRAADSTDNTGGTMWASDMELSTMQPQDDLYFRNEQSEGSASDGLDMGWEE